MLPSALTAGTHPDGNLGAPMVVYAGASRGSRGGRLFTSFLTG